jgi:GNAT superfamily N-acetyltransferase
MIVREATIADIPQIQIVRNSVKENTLSDPSRITDKDCEEYITLRGKGWVSERNGIITGFAIVDLLHHDVWALFLHPDEEGRGTGLKLHHTMMNWYFSKTDHTIWLGTDAGTRAEKFYTRAGWVAIERKDYPAPNAAAVTRTEVKFEMTRLRWLSLQSEA